ncbi:MAG: lyase [Sphingomicrobium sp.]
MDRYEPPSAFLKSLIDDDAPLMGAEGESNRRRLMTLMRDEHLANRDWATLLLAQQDLDTDDVRQALLSAADDENECVRAEAILGLAQRDGALALPLVRRELGRERVAVPLFEAAALIADPSLVNDLRDFAAPSDNAILDELAAKALSACEAAA